MSGIYIHIPFCKQACHYCDFHFSTSMKRKDEMVLALQTEISLRKEELGKELVETIYFGGGTPSVLTNRDIEKLLDAVYTNFDVADSPEITLEANPDDLTLERIVQLSETKINRLSIGIQSFFEGDLKAMNRAHSTKQASDCLEMACSYFENVSIDLIYGIPGMSNQKWEQNIQKALSYKVNHISSYALTIEPKTALRKMIDAKKVLAPTEDAAKEHFEILVNSLQKNGFIHYEVSNFCKPTFYSKNNSAYWLGKKYLGIGPSAHSYDGIKRSWNIANNALYLKAITENKLVNEVEVLTLSDKYNEYVMTSLRTIWGVSLEFVLNNFGKLYLDYFTKKSQNFLEENLLLKENNLITTTAKGIFLVDGIASELFYIK